MYSAETVLKMEQDIHRLEAEVKRLNRIIELKNHTIDRWVPCPDHRDKTKDMCYVCENEYLKRKLYGDPYKQI